MDWPGLTKKRLSLGLGQFHGHDHAMDMVSMAMPMAMPHGHGQLGMPRTVRGHVMNNVNQHAISMAMVMDMVISVPARLGKGQGAKEIGHNLAREKPKFGHNLVSERHKIGHSLEREWPKFSRNPAHERNEVWAQFCGRSMKTWAQICKHFTSIFTSLSENTKQQLHFVNNIFFFFSNSGRALYNRAGRKTGIMSTLRRTRN